jgi:GNAT superfamily N-acetyltransferase
MITIERAKSAHREALNDLIQRQFEEHDILITGDILVSAIHEVLVRSELGFFVIAKENEQIIGLAAVSFVWTLEYGGRSAWLDELYVLPEHRGQGIGGLLLEKVVEEAQREECRAIDLEIKEEHRRAERLYEKKGFKRLMRSRWARPLI